MRLDDCHYPVRMEGPAGGSRDRGLQPHDPSLLRISDEDRHQVAEVLRRAAGEGRIDLAELDERLDAAYSAKTYGDLVPITADLPVAHPAVRPVPNQRIPSQNLPSHASSVALMSETKRKGPWLVPEQHSVFSMMGSVQLDLREARFTARETTINAVSVMGDITIYVNANTHVLVEGVPIMAEFAESRPKVAAELTPDSPVLRVRGLALMASVTVQRRAMPRSLPR